MGQLIAMHFSFTEEQLMIAETAGQLFARQATSDRTRRAMVGEGVDRELWRAVTAELALASVALPERHGGAGLGHVELAIIAEAAGRHVAALPLIASFGLAAPAILAGGSDAQRDRWLPPISGGEVIASFVETDEAMLKGQRLRGSAAFVPHGAVASLYVVAVGNAMVLVDRAAPGLSVTPVSTMDQTRPFATMNFDDVPCDPLSSPVAAAAAATGAGCVMIAADALGGAQACLDRTTAYARERVQFGRSIASFQSVKHRLADMMVEIEQARSAVYWAACALDEEAPDTLIAIAAAKAFATDTFAACAAAMIQLHGGIGFTWEHDAHLFFKRAQANRSWLGTPDRHRERIAVLIGLDEAA